MKPQTKALLDSVRGLPPTELDELMLALRASLSLKVDRSGDWLLDGLLYELQRRGVEGRIPPKQAVKLVPGYATTAATVRSELQRRLSRPLKPAETVSLGRTVARALATYLAAAGAPLGVKVLLSNVGKSLAALDESFPGYLEAGMLEMLVQARSSER